MSSSGGPGSTAEPTGPLERELLGGILSRVPGSRALLTGLRREAFRSPPHAALFDVIFAGVNARGEVPSLSELPLTARENRLQFDLSTAAAILGDFYHLPDAERARVRLLELDADRRRSEILKRAASRIEIGEAPSTVDRETCQALAELARTIDAGRFRRAAETWTDLHAAEIPEPPSILGDVLRPGGFLLLSGKPYSGKSMLMLQAAVAIATGKPLFGLDTTKTRVAILSMELTRPALQRRLRSIDPDVAAGENIILLSREELGAVDLLMPEDVEGLRGLIEAKEIGLVMLDPLRRITRGDEKKSEDMIRLCESIDDLRYGTGAAFWIAHHDRKSSQGDGADADLDRPSGSGVLTSFPTTNAALIAKHGLLVLSWHVNDGESPTPTWYRKGVSGLLVPTDAPEESKTVAERNRESIASYLDSKAPTAFADREIFDALMLKGSTGKLLGIATLSKNYLPQLKEAGRVLKLEGGRGRINRWRSTREAPETRNLEFEASDHSVPTYASTFTTS